MAQGPRKRSNCGVVLTGEQMPEVIEPWMLAAAKEILIKDSFALEDDARITAKHYRSRELHDLMAELREAP